MDQDPVDECHKVNAELIHLCLQRAVGQKYVPEKESWYWTHGPKPAVLWWFNFDPYPKTVLNFSASGSAIGWLRNPCNAPAKKPWNDSIRMQIPNGFPWLQSGAGFGFCPPAWTVL